MEIKDEEGKTHKGLNTTTSDQPDTFPAWRTSGEDAPVDGVQNMSSAEVAAGADQESAPAEEAAGANPAGKIETQRQRVANLLTQRHRRYQSDA